MPQVMADESLQRRISPGEAQTLTRILPRAAAGAALAAFFARRRLRRNYQAASRRRAAKQTIAMRCHDIFTWASNYFHATIY